MKDLRERVKAALTDTMCGNHHDNQYEDCGDCAREMKVVIKELMELEAKLVEALKYYANAECWNEVLEDFGNIASKALKELEQYQKVGEQYVK